MLKTSKIASFQHLKCLKSYELAPKMLKTTAKNGFLGKYYVFIQPQSASKIQIQLFSPPIGSPPPTTVILTVPKLSPT